MEPRIQYAQTADGVSIAFWTLGEGLPFVQMTSLPHSHIQLEWQVPQVRRWYERVAEKRKLVRYDLRGCGLSDRDVTDFSLEAHVLDLKAVVDRLGLEKFALFGFLHAGPAAITYAARHPERVSHLVLWCSYARASDYLRSSPQAQATRSLLDKDWELYTETVAHYSLGWSAPEEARRFAAFIRECVTQETAQAAYGASAEFDVAALLAEVSSPTLVLHRRQVPLPDVALARDLASRIPDARLTLLEGTFIGPWMGDMEAVLAAIDEFLGEGEETGAAALPSGLVTILFTDMEGSTTLTQRVGDAKAQEVLRTHNRIVRDALKTHSGSEIKHTGDGIMASFASASRALECAIAIQRTLAQHNESNPDMPIRVRIGLNAGEPVAEEADLFGTAVQLAARICAQAEPGEILAPIVVRELAAGKGFLLADRGDVVLRGFEDPVRLYEVHWREEG
ncbi:MAG: adenylate/guanylate cyclase domain-containing protein [Dehalococcoidia bacterium]|nr:MAG: adenylate/guanylate cyclase domain-containing protein [Dehalococcoidia bacterium]